VNLSARLVGLEQVFGRLARLGDALAGPAIAASTDALAQEIEQARDAEGLSVPLVRDASARRSSLGVTDPAAIAQELGTLEQAPAPWLAPALPAALGQVRAAAQARVRDIVAAHAGKPDAVARTLSSRRTGK
jgi:hypothetical protein